MTNPRSVSAENHPDEELLRAYLDGSLPEHDAQRVEDHVEKCSMCQHALENILNRHPAPFVGAARTDLDDAVPPGIPRYTSPRRINVGGMGVIWQMRDSHFHRNVAVKVMKNRDASSPTRVRRFLAEAQISSQLTHPFIVPIHDLGTLTDGRAYYVMRFVEGTTLDAAFPKETRRENYMQRLRVFTSICQAVAFAHRKGVIHRDLKPQNVMIGAHGEVQVMDWGLAKSLHDPTSKRLDRDATPVVETVRETRDRTRGDQALGTYAYMSPEQARNPLEVDQRSDVFALGAILCELLTGDPPYRGHNRAIVEGKARTGDLSDARERLEASGADRRMIELALRCLSPETDRRPSSAEEVTRGVEAYLASVEEELREERAKNERQQVIAEEARKRRRLWRGLAAATVISLLLAGATAYVLQERRHQYQRDLATRSAQIRSILEEASGQMREGDFSLVQSQLRSLKNLFPENGLDILAARRDRIVAELTLVKELEDIHTQRFEVPLSRFRGKVIPRSDSQELLALEATAQAYARAFERYLGVNNADNNVFYTRFAGSPAIPWVVAALDDWAWICNRLAATEDETSAALSTQTDRLFALAQKLDPSNLGRILRRRASWTDSEELNALLADIDRDRCSLGLLRLFVEIGLHSSLNPEKLFPATLQEFPRDFWLNLRWGMLLAEQGDPDALRYCQAALTLRPESTTALLNLATFLSNDDRPDDAARLFQEALRLTPNNPTAHNNLGTVLFDQGMLDEAAEHFEKAIAFNSNQNYVLPYVNWGNLLKARRQYDGAEQKYRTAIVRNPNSSFAHYSLALLQQDQGRLDDARESYEEAIERDQGYSFAHNNLGNVLVALARREQQQGRLGQSQAYLEEAQQRYKLAMRFDPTNSMAYTNYGSILEERGISREAAILFHEEAVEIDPRNRIARFNLANTLLHERRLAESIVHFRECLRLDQNDSATHHALGLALGRSGRFAEGVSQLEEARRLLNQQDPTAVDLRQQIEELADLARLDRELADFVRSAWDIKNRNDASGVAYLFYCKADFLNATKTFTTAFERFPEMSEDPWVLFLAARCATLAAAMWENDRVAAESDSPLSLRAKALGWLKKSLEVLTQDEGNAPEKQADLDRYLNRLLLEPELESVRSRASRSQWLEDERTQWKRFWDEVMMAIR